MNRFYMVVAYIRISTNKQHIENQESEILRFVRHKGLSVDYWCRDVMSGKVNSKNRKLGDLLKCLQAGDSLIVTEISRLSRSLLDIMEVIHICIQRKIVLYSTKEGYAFENNLNSKVLAFAFGLVAEIERNLISLRTKEALAIRKANGVALGRPKGSSRQLRLLLTHKAGVEELFRAHFSYKEIATRYEVSPSTLGRFIKKYILKE